MDNNFPICATNALKKFPSTGVMRRTERFSAQICNFHDQADPGQCDHNKDNNGKCNFRIAGNVVNYAVKMLADFVVYLFFGAHSEGVLSAYFYTKIIRILSRTGKRNRDCFSKCPITLKISFRMLSNIV